MDLLLHEKLVSAHLIISDSAVLLALVLVNHENVTFTVHMFSSFRPSKYSVFFVFYIYLGSQFNQMYL